MAHPSIATRVAALLFCAGAAGASDGVLEINQTCATTTGCFTGDTAGYPVTITVKGSYRLTSNLDYPSSTSRAIHSTVADVSIDLAGFTISGTNGCQGSPSGWVVSCAQSNGLEGIQTAFRSRVSNGRVIGAGGSCVSLGDASEASQLLLSDCGGEGLTLGGRSVAVEISAIGNLNSGIYAYGGVRARDVVVTNNGGEGIGVSSGSVDGVTAASNQDSGIFALAGASIKNFSSIGNGLYGVYIWDGSIADTGAIRDNDKKSLGACGIRGSGGAAFRGVAITALSGGPAATSCSIVNLGQNTCQGGACPP